MQILVLRVSVVIMLISRVSYSSWCVLDMIIVCGIIMFSVKCCGVLFMCSGMYMCMLLVVLGLKVLNGWLVVMLVSMLWVSVLLCGLLILVVLVEVSIMFFGDSSLMWLVFIGFSVVRCFCSVVSEKLMVNILRNLLFLMIGVFNVFISICCLVMLYVQGLLILGSLLWLGIMYQLLELLVVLVQLVIIDCCGLLFCQVQQFMQWLVVLCVLVLMNFVFLLLKVLVFYMVFLFSY